MYFVAKTFLIQIKQIKTTVIMFIVLNSNDQNKIFTQMIKQTIYNFNGIFDVFFLLITVVSLDFS